MTPVNALFGGEQGGVAASPQATQRGFDFSDSFGVFSPAIRHRLTTTLGTTYLVEPLGYVETDASWGKCLSARFLDSRGYWAEGDFRLDQIASLEPELFPQIAVSGGGGSSAPDAQSER